MDFAVTKAPVEWSPWATTQHQYDYGEWTTQPVPPSEASPVLVTDVSFASLRTLPETNYSQSIKLPDWPLPLDDEQRSLVVGEILEYPKLQVGWDGSPDDVPPSSASADQAATFVELLPAFVPVPEPSAAADGEIILFWRDPNLYVEVGFRGGDVYSYFAEGPSEKVKGSARVDAMFSSADALATFLIKAFTDGVVHL